MNHIDIRGPVLASTVRSGGVLSAKDVTVTLPSITPLTIEVRAMGTLTLPVWALLENMEMTINKIGVDMGLARFARMEIDDHEFRWVQNVIKADGRSTPEGCKAFVRAVPLSIPGTAVEIGVAPESDISFSATRYQLFAGGEELWCIDRLAGICRIYGKDYYKEIESFL